MVSIHYPTGCLSRVQGVRTSRDTAATIMSEVGIQDRDIIHVTGHKELIKLNINLSQII